MRLYKRSLYLGWIVFSAVFFFSAVSYAGTNYNMIEDDTYNIQYIASTYSFQQGYSVAIGDVNEDGLDDLIIGDSDSDAAGKTNAGAVYVILSSTVKEHGGKVNLLTTGNYDIRYDGGAVSDFTGIFVTVGDVNGDSKGDLIIGSPQSDNNSRVTSGSIYVILSSKLKNQSGNINLATSSNYSIRYDGAAAGDWLGDTLSTGDVNQDSLGDLILNAWGADFGGFDRGSAYVILSSKVVSQSGNIDLSNAANYNIRYDGVVDYDRFGCYSAVGDINGDSFGDLIIGAKYADNNGKGSSGSVYVLSSATVANDTGIVSMSSSSNYDIRYDGENVNDSLGTVITTGDLNQDGNGDLVIGVEQAGFMGTYSGSAYVIFSSKVAAQSGNVLLSNSNNYSIRYDGETTSNYLGNFVAVGDLDTDGFDDLVLTARYRDARGSVYTINSSLIASQSGIIVLNDSNSYTSRYDHFNSGVSFGDHLAVGDVNEDGFNDLAIVAKGAEWTDLFTTVVILSDPVTAPLPAAAYDSNDASVTATSPGTLAPVGAISRVALDDDALWRTSFSQPDMGYDSQVFRFRPDTTGITSPVFVVNWDGYGEAVTGYDVYLNIWNFTTSDWEEIDTNHVATDAAGVELFGYKIGSDYIDGNGDVWVWAKADNKLSTVAITNGPSAVQNGVNETVTWTTNTAAKGIVAYDLTSHTAGSFDDYRYFDNDGEEVVSSHNITLSGLVLFQTYYYRVRSVDSDGGIVDSSEMSFGSCFTSDTPIIMADGSEVKIQDVKVGDKVLSWDMDKNEAAEGTVEEVWSGKQGNIYAINGTIKGTWAHPFWTKEVGWASVNPEATNEKYQWKPEKLEEGYHLMDSNGAWVKVTSIRKQREEAMTYNLTKVGKENNYFARGVLAHNKFCAFLFAKDEEKKREEFEFVTLGVFEEPGNIESRLVNDRIFKQNEGYSYLKLKNKTNKYVLRIPPHQMDYIDYVGLKVVDKLNVESLSEKDKKLYDKGKLKETKEYTLSLQSSSSGVKLMNKDDGKYYRIADEEGVPYPNNVELTFEPLPKEDARYTREVMFVEKGYYEPFEGAKIWYDEAPFNQKEWRAWLDKNDNEETLAYIIRRETREQNRMAAFKEDLMASSVYFNRMYYRANPPKLSLKVIDFNQITEINQ